MRFKITVTKEYFFEVDAPNVQVATYLCEKTAMGEIENILKVPQFRGKSVTDIKSEVIG